MTFKDLIQAYHKKFENIIPPYNDFVKNSLDANKEIVKNPYPEFLNIQDVLEPENVGAYFKSDVLGEYLSNSCNKISDVAGDIMKKYGFDVVDLINAKAETFVSKVYSEADKLNPYKAPVEV